MLSEACPDCGPLAPEGKRSLGPPVHFQVDDGVAWTTLAVTAATPLEAAPTHQLCAGRSACVCDPFGPPWRLGHQIEPVTPEANQRR